MGVVQQSNILYLNVSSGKFVNKKKGVSCFAYEGSIIGIEEADDEYEGKVVPKIKLKLSDGKETAVVSFTTESYYSLGFFQRIRKVDLSKPIMLGISNSDKNEKVSFCWIKQSGAVIKKEEDFPMPEKKKEGKKEFTSWANPVPEFEKIVKELQEKLKSVQPVEQSSSDKSEEQVEDVKTDLPF